jgi:4-hydroxybenzoate polyprenyltransferase
LSESTTPTATDPPLPFHRKWWTYQRERFPLAGHGPLIAAFSFCAVSLSAMLRGSTAWPAWPAIVVAFVTCFCIFLQLRIADEFKDFEEDSRYRPYRAVPRGLVTLRELRWLFAIVGLVQLLLALWLDARLIVLLLVTWAYLALMSKEFFVAEWLRPRAVLYMTSHMVIMPLVDLYATSADWLPITGQPPPGLMWFLLASYFNGLVIEIGRKIRSPQDEETGVATYSALWGRRKAVMSWWAVMLATLAFALIVAHRPDRLALIGGVLTCVFIAAIIVGWSFLKSEQPGRGKVIERYSGIWTLALYLSLGLLPHFVPGGTP